MAAVNTVTALAVPPEIERIWAATRATADPIAWKQEIDAISRRSLLVHCALVLSLWLLWSLIDSPAVFLIAGGCIYLPGAIYMAWNESKATPILISPLSWWFGWEALSLGLAPIWLGFRRMDVSSVYYVAQEVSMDDVALGFPIYAAGALAMHFGLQRGRCRGTIPPGEPGGGSFGVLLILWITGVLIPFTGNRLSSLGAFVGPLQTGALSAACSLAIAPPRLIPRGSPMYWGAVAAATAGCIVGNAMIGLKFMIMISTLPLLWIALMNRRLRASLLILLPAMALVYVYAVEPVVDGLRGLTKTAAIGDSLIEDAQRGALGDVVSVDQNSVAQRLDGATERIFSGTYLAYLIEDVRAGGYKYGATMEYMLYAFVPRILWPDKPAVSRGSWLTVELGGADSIETADSASALTAEGELYWNFGIAGEIVGMAAIGWLIACFLWRQSGPDPRRDPIRMLALLTTVFLVSGELEAGTLVVTIVIEALYFFALRKIYDSFVVAA
jgi:hypothetical protein